MHAQSAIINDPVLISPTFRVYIANSGNDTNNGDSLTPLATFSAALDKLNALSGSPTGDVYGEAVFYSGTYAQQINQPYNKYLIGAKRMNVSVRGKGSVILDGTAVTVNPGSGMISLLGSNIHVKNLSVNYSTHNGVRFGYNYSGIVVNSHDIWIDSVDVGQTAGHGILVGIGALNANGSSTLIPRAKRFKITHCHVHDAVNYNTPQSQWGSSIKFWNTSHNQAINNHVHDNSGEGINFDFCDTALVRGNLLHDNYANVYLDKVQYAVVEKNHIYNEVKVVSGILMGLEAFTAYVTDHYMKDIYVQNNIIHNTTGINIWQGIYSAIQNGFFNNIQIRHNTIIGKQFANGAQISLSYETAFGQPVPNVSFNNLSYERNIITAHVDSLNNTKMLTAPLDPQPGLTTGYNLFNRNPGFGYNPASDQIVTALPVYVDPASDVVNGLTPSNVQHPDLIMNVTNTSGLEDDFSGTSRGATTNVGAIEQNDQLGMITSEADEILLFPNPADAEFRVRLDQEAMGYSLRIVDILGQELLFVSNYQGQCISTSYLTPGNYFVWVSGSGGTKKILPLVIL
jgi:hypothetical protein